MSTSIFKLNVNWKIFRKNIFSRQTEWGLPKMCAAARSYQWAVRLQLIMFEIEMLAICGRQQQRALNTKTEMQKEEKTASEKLSSVFQLRTGAMLDITVYAAWRTLTNIYRVLQRLWTKLNYSNKPSIQ